MEEPVAEGGGCVGAGNRGRHGCDDRNVTGTDAVIAVMIPFRGVMVIAIGSPFMPVIIRRIGARSQSRRDVLGRAVIHAGRKTFARIEKCQQECQDDMEKRTAHEYGRREI